MQLDKTKLSTLYIYDIEIMNTDDSFIYYRTYCYGIDRKRINILRKNGFNITSIYPRNNNEGCDALRLEINLKRKFYTKLETSN